MREHCHEGFASEKRGKGEYAEMIIGGECFATKAPRHEETRRFCRGEKSKGGCAEMIFGRECFY